MPRLWINPVPQSPWDDTPQFCHIRLPTLRDESDSGISKGLDPLQASRKRLVLLGDLCYFNSTFAD